VCSLWTEGRQRTYLCRGGGRVALGGGGELQRGAVLHRDSEEMVGNGGWRFALKERERETDNRQIVRLVLKKSI
jgi:hypothetical protein